MEWGSFLEGDFGDSRELLLTVVSTIDNDPPVLPSSRFATFEAVSQLAKVSIGFVCCVRLLMSLIFRNHLDAANLINLLVVATQRR